MSSIIKKQSALTLYVLIFATFMIAGAIISSSLENTVFARSHQKIDQSNHIKQNANCLSVGGNSPISDSCNPTAVAANDNSGGNGASGGSDGGDSDQKIKQSNHIKQNANCLSVGGNSPISASCNPTAVAANANSGGNGASGGSDGGDSDQKIK